VQLLLDDVFELLVFAYQVPTEQIASSRIIAKDHLEVAQH